ncbi:MAG: hypothetical protein JOZ69_25800, partial [Myxococcales bacterium]|nr:hypothetical protein [Myxococcales bacterium]
RRLMRAQARLSGAILLGLALVAPVAPSAGWGAEPPRPTPSGTVNLEGQPQHEHPSLLDRPHTIAQLELGILTLPNAPLSPSNRGGQTPFIGTVGSGDATVQTGVHLSYRATRDWAFGARALFAPRPTSDPNYGGASGLSRTHSRSYLFLGGEARYYALRSRVFEGWVGVTGGAVIIADRFTTNSAPAVPSILGTNTVTVSTEGFAVGVQAGADYLINDQFVIGLALGADQWILPFSPDKSCDPIRDCPTLTGSVRAFEIGITVGYRIPL